MKLNEYEISACGAAQAPESPRLFTPQEANAALPLVVRIVRDIVQSYQQAHEFHRRLHALSESASSQQACQLLHGRDAAVAHLQSLRAELQAVGCELKDAECGLVDFPGMRGERPVCLCWRLGEERVAYWHGHGAGFGSRRPIDDGSQFRVPPSD